jgi:hypothetical protein
MNDYDFAKAAIAKGMNPAFVLVRGESGKWYLTFVSGDVVNFDGSDHHLEARGQAWSTDPDSYGRDGSDLVPTFHQGAHIYQLRRSNYGTEWKECPSVSAIKANNYNILGE